MSNWLKSVKPSPRRGKFEFVSDTIKDREMFNEANSTLRGTYYRMVIVPCSLCKKLFRIDKDKNAIYDHKEYNKNCPMCQKKPDQLYLMVSEKEKVAIAKLHESQGCTKRKMTPEELIKYNVKTNVR